MSTYEIVGTVIGSITILSIILGSIWAITKIVFKLGEYKGSLDASKKETDSKISELNSIFLNFSKEANTKLDNISDRLSKVEGKLE